MQGDKHSCRRVLKVIYMHTSAGKSLNKCHTILTTGRSVLQSRAGRPQLSPETLLCKTLTSAQSVEMWSCGERKPCAEPPESQTSLPLSSAVRGRSCASRKRDTNDAFVQPAGINQYEPAVLHQRLLLSKHGQTYNVDPPTAEGLR
jgi:hypothetical protein